MSNKVEEINVEELVTGQPETEEVIERPYTLRKLKDADLWKVLKILKKTLPEDVTKAILKLITGDMKAEEAGMLGMMNVGAEIIKNMDKAETEITEWCADLAGVTVEELYEMEFGTTPLIITDVVSNAKNVPFFKVLFKFFS